MKAVVRQPGFALFVLAVLAGASSAQTPVPLIYQPLQPTAVAPGGPGLALTVRGTGFAPGAVVEWDGQPLTTTFVSASELRAAVAASDVATPKTATITVQNPGVAVSSNFIYFQVATPISGLGYVQAPQSPTWLGETLGNLNMPFSVAAGDFEGNGKQDLAVAIDDGSGPGFLDLLSSNGDGTFTPKSSIGVVGAGPGAIATGDFTGSGRLDIATSNVDDDTVSVLLNNGDGTFSPAPGSPLSVGHIPSGIVAADLNRDGKLDLAVACQGALYVFLGNGDGSFAPAPGGPIALPSGAVDLAVGDFNGDGNLDLAATNLGDQVFILLGKGDGTFQPPEDLVLPYWVAGGTTAIGAADLNGDGKLDLVVAQNGNQSIDVLLGKGDGTFTQVPAPIPGCCASWAFNLISAWALDFGDFLANGKLDFAVVERNGDASTLNNYILVYLGNGDGTFTPSPYSMLLPEEPDTGLTVGDFNGDGLLDIATVTQPQNYYVTLLEQQPGPPPDFSVAAVTPASVTVAQGAAASYGLGVTSRNGFTGAVYLTCASGLPPEASCSFTPYYDPLPNGTAATGGGGGPNPGEAAGVVVPGPPNAPPDFTPTLTIQTTAPKTTAAMARWRPSWRDPLFLLVVAALLGGWGWRRRLREEASGFAGLCLAVLFGLLAVSCGGRPPAIQPPPPPSGTPPGTYTITINASAYQGTSFAFSHSTELTLTVQDAGGAAARGAPGP